MCWPSLFNGSRQMLVMYVCIIAAMEKISSTTNPLIKNIRRLDKPAERKALGQFIAEGLREIALAQRAGYKIQTLLVCPPLLTEQNEYPLQPLLNQSATVKEVTEEVYRSIAYRESTPRVFWLFCKPEASCCKT
jgi:RNA methyltransferase, TrmH family